MKSNKQKRKELKTARIAKQAKREIARRESLIGYRPGHKIAVNPKALSEKSQRSWSIPEFYEDEYFKCIDCGKESLFSAEQQQEWYEVKKRYFFQRPVRCHHHYMEWSFGRRSKFRMDKALGKLKQFPKSKEAKLACALSIIEFHKNTGKGNLHTAIHLLRQLKEQGEAMEYCNEQIQKVIQAKAEMENFIDLLKRETIDALQQASGKQDQLKAILLECLSRGYDGGINNYQLWDIITDNDCILTQAQLPEADEIIVRNYMTFLINEISDDMENGEASLQEALEHHRRRIKKLYDSLISENNDT